MVQFDQYFSGGLKPPTRLASVSLKTQRNHWTVEPLWAAKPLQFSRFSARRQVLGMSEDFLLPCGLYQAGGEYSREISKKSWGLKEELS